MRLLLTSSGITNQSLRDTVELLLGKPISESSALFIPTAIYPFPGGAKFAWDPIAGKSKGVVCDLGWKSMGILELSVLPSIEKEAWVPMVEQTDAFLVWGGDVLFLSDWMRKSGLADLFPKLRPEAVYVGVSAGSMAASSLFGETYRDAPRGSGDPLSTADMVFTTPEGGIQRKLVTGRGIGLVDFALIPHLGNKNHPDASLENAEKWAAKIPRPTYAIDDQTALKVVDGKVEVISEGQWKYFPR